MASDHSPSASDLLSWPLLDFNTPLSCLLHEELQHPPSFMGSKESTPQSSSLNPSPALTRSPPLLSSPASMGAFTAKVTKRKSRAASKPPTRVLSVDTATFRDVVQKHTGLSNSPSMQQAGQRQWGAAGSLPLRSSRNGLKAAPHHSMLSTHDTSSPYLARGYSSSNSKVYNESGFESPYGVQLPWWYTTEEREMGMDTESLRWLHRASELENLLLSSNKEEDGLRSRIDQWLFSDLLRTPSPRVEAHSL